MNKIIDRLIILIIGIACVWFAGYPEYNRITAVLVMIIYSGLAYYLSEKRHCHMLASLMSMVILIDDGFLPCMIVMFYDTVFSAKNKNYKGLMVLISCIVLYIFLIVQGRDYFYINEILSNNVLIVLWIWGVIMGVYLAFNTSEIMTLRKEKVLIRDEGEEIRQLMRQKNKYIREQQDSEITMATLRERNRIAREIHDNVGHLLSRSILQVGALRAIYKEEPIAEALLSLQDTLNESMTSVRNSVHDLHNESLDLHKSISELISQNTRFDVNFDYDMSDFVPRKIKYCIISIITEAFQNTNKHSNGNKIDIELREHPGLFQLVFSDNGHCNNITESGIGLHNMKSRVDELEGSMRISTESGFRIFISIPKNQKTQTEGKL